MKHETQYIHDKLYQLTLLINYIKFAKTSSQKLKIEQEVEQIRHLMNNAKSVTITEAQIQSRLNHEDTKETTRLKEGPRRFTPSRRLSHTTKVE